jgi:crossover junction endodeoxyribonuclease RusA
MSELRLTIPLQPPTVNHYVKHTRAGRHYLTAAATAWYQAVGIIARGAFLDGKQHAVEYTVYQGHGNRGDVDGYAKVILDGLVKAGVLRSDASVVSLYAHKLRDRANPRTEIVVRRLK